MSELNPSLGKAFKLIADNKDEYRFIIHTSIRHNNQDFCVLSNMVLSPEGNCSVFPMLSVFINEEILQYLEQAGLVYEKDFLKHIPGSIKCETNLMNFKGNLEDVLNVLEMVNQLRKILKAKLTT